MDAVQIIVNSAYAAAVYTLCALGFALTYRTARFFNFAHGFSIVSGPYTAYLLKNFCGMPLLVACVAGVCVAGAIGCVLDLVIFRPMRRRRATALTLLLASLGAYVVLQNVLSLLFGDQTVILREVAAPRVWSIGGAQLTQIQVLTVAAALVCTAGLFAFLRCTPHGRIIRAVAGDAELAAICGLPSKRVVLITFGVGAALAGLAGILLALDVDLTPAMGLPYLITAVVVVIIGGTSSVGRIILGACLLSAAQNVGVRVVGAQWQDAIAFAVLLLVLLGRTHCGRVNLLVTNRASD